MIKIALLGFGTVGQGTFDILNNKSGTIKKILGEEVKVSKILKRNLNFKTALPRDIFTDDFNEIINDSEIKLICEMTGDINSSYEYIKKALINKKHVVTANKGVVSEHFEEFLALAEENNVNFLFESSVAGSVPIIDPLKKQTLINSINKIRGILNGTSNYILYKMTEENMEYSEVLKNAQNLGYAEADPYDDVEGIDALRKLRILSTIAFKSEILNNDIKHYGIGSVKKDDIEYLKENNTVLKLIAQANKYDSSFMAIVEPVVLNNNDLLAKIDNAFNSVEITGENYETLSFTGEGAGKYPTGNAVVTDIIDALNGKTLPVVVNSSFENINSTFSSSYYVRVNKDIDLSDICESEKISSNYKFIITKDIKREDLVKRLSALKPDEYFFARVN